MKEEMAKRKWEKQFIYDQQITPMHPPEDFPHAQNLMGMHDPANHPAKGAWVVAGAWTKKAIPEDEHMKPHVHDYDEVLMQIGSNPDDWSDLGGEIEMWIEDEKYIVNKTCILFLPAGVPHGPFIVRRVDRPIITYAISAGMRGHALKHSYYVNNPKWSHLEDPPEPSGLQEYKGQKVTPPQNVTRWND